jgi:ABC-type sugar transport system permease subunit
VTGSRSRQGAEARLAWIYMAPALLTVAAVALFPALWTFWESLHRHDLRAPSEGRPFVGLANYAEALSTPRFRAALGHTLLFVVVTVTLELLLGLLLALALDRAFRGRALARAAVLVPWAIPTVVAAIVWRFLFTSDSGLVNALLARAGVVDASFVWFTRARAAWVPVVAADVWKMTPFVVLLLLAGLQNIPRELYEAARLDGAGWWRQLRFITLPLLMPALVVAGLFRALDALRVFDLIYVLTGGGPGTATEPIALYVFQSLFQNLRFGYGSALSVVVFLLVFLLALLVIRGYGARLLRVDP